MFPLLSNIFFHCFGNNYFGGKYMAIKLLVFDFRESERDFFRSHELENFEITFFPESLNKETLKNLSSDLLEQTAVISVFVDSEVTEEVINSFKNLRIISTRSTGVEHINKKAADAKNIAVVNVEGYGARPVAQYTIGLILALVRQIIPASEYLKSENRICQSFVGRDISKFTIGIVGTGSIGFAVAKHALAFGMKVLAYDIAERKELTEKYEIQYVDFNTLLRNADIVSIHIPYTGENKDMFGFEQFSIMKNTAYLINTSRGEIVNIRDLYNAVTKGAIKGAALDVVTCEYFNFKCSNLSHTLHNNFNCVEEAKILREFVKHPDVIVTPHIAYETQDAIDYILEVTFIAISDIIKGGNSYRVN